MQNARYNRMHYEDSELCYVPKTLKKAACKAALILSSLCNSCGRALLSMAFHSEISS